MKTFENIRRIRMKPFTNNTVDKDVQLTLLPLNLMQYCMFCPKYRIKNDRLTPNGIISNFVSLIATLLLVCLFGYSSVMIYQESINTTTFMNITAYCDTFYYFVGFALNYIVGVLQNKKYIKFVHTFQKLNRVLKNETFLKNFVVWNWIFVIVPFVGHFLLYASVSIFIQLPYASFYFCYILIISDFNVIYPLRVIKLLQNKVELWNIWVLNSPNIIGMHGNNSNKAFQAYVDIVDCYATNTDCFQHVILYFTIGLFCHVLLYIQGSIESSKFGFVFNDKDVSILGVMSAVIWITKNLMYTTMLTQQCEKFYLSIQHVQDTCAQILMTNCSDDHRRLCKNVLRLHRASFSKIRVCGLFYVDAASQLSLMSHLTNYTIVLLQFAFL